MIYSPRPFSENQLVSKETLRSPEWEGSNLEDLLSQRTPSEKEREADIAQRIDEAFKEWKTLEAEQIKPFAGYGYIPLTERSEWLLKAMLRGYLS